MNATLLPDDPTVTWKPQIIAKQILKQVHSLDIDTIITFDRDGVSNHANHCAIFYSSISIYVANLLSEGKFNIPFLLHFQCKLMLENEGICHFSTFFDIIEILRGKWKLSLKIFCLSKNTQCSE